MSTASPVTPHGQENVTSFRAVPERALLGQQLDPLNELPGRWFGSGGLSWPDFSVATLVKTF
jgi:hypothetical protein